jgi:hypothetical protein
VVCFGSDVLFGPLIPEEGSVNSQHVNYSPKIFAKTVFIREFVAVSCNCI